MPSIFIFQHRRQSLCSMQSVQYAAKAGSGSGEQSLGQSLVEPGVEPVVEPGAGCDKKLGWSLGTRLTRRRY